MTSTALETDRFRILDALLLISAFAISAAIIGTHVDTSNTFADVLFSTHIAIRILTLTLAARILWRHVRFRHTFWSKGKLSVLAVASAFVLDAASLWSIIAFDNPYEIQDSLSIRLHDFWQILWNHYNRGFETPANVTVAAWIAHQLLVGKTSNRRDWIDTVGVVLGLFWIVGALSIQAVLHFVA
ncbi:hypothetical protein [Rhodopirellula sp. MGV]|uniref:hypothetical protein n=1 Tax=Rhodopirellula sp. MGV TaxID=2023130 RepID=UPI000B9775D8|nr:hypothetical protein [Rhodopirellula sp. MGV]OYP37602.1 hypothetical protein CGZ80_04620 [Rhodopirellula sp. MGV]PNY34922.1 hypothetical protein C2E31_20670 [Rhodopirellula baltica]PNY37068.1 hypothetical protein C2E31_09740 [Rhodopirellula baltica]